jgi:hypothetical protein
MLSAMTSVNPEVSTVRVRISPYVAVLVLFHIQSMGYTPRNNWATRPIVYIKSLLAYCPKGNIPIRYIDAAYSPVGADLRVCPDQGTRAGAPLYAYGVIKQNWYYAPEKTHQEQRASDRLAGWKDEASPAPATARTGPTSASTGLPRISLAPASTAYNTPLEGKYTSPWLTTGVPITARTRISLVGKHPFTSSVALP